MVTVVNVRLISLTLTYTYRLLAAVSLPATLATLEHNLGKVCAADIVRMALAGGAALRVAIPRTPGLLSRARFLQQYAA